MPRYAELRNKLASKYNLEKLRTQTELLDEHELTLLDYLIIIGYLYTKKGYEASDLSLNLDAYNPQSYIVAAIRMLHAHFPKINVELSKNEVGIMEAGMRARFKCQSCIATLDILFLSKKPQITEQRYQLGRNISIK